MQEVKQKARQLFAGFNGSHGWEHTLRVHRLCEVIGRKENADLTVLSVAAYLHDIGRGRQDASNGLICHAQEGVRMARDIVLPLNISKAQKENIFHCIRSHRFRKPPEPTTLEAMILFDGDKLDAIGAVGVARTFLFAGEVGAKLHNPDIAVEDTRPYSREDTGYREYAVKLSKIKDRMLTPTGKQMARERHDFMKAFFDRFVEEYQGKR